MSGHSKWHNIQARKGKQDAIRSNIFSKLSKLITIAARSGGDPSMNFSLRLAVEKAKSAGMPKDNIERAIKKGMGELGGVQLEEMMYEAYGPGGVAIVIKALSDNKNRTLQEVKHILSKNGGSLGNSGSVLWMFEQLGYASIEKDALYNFGKTREEFELLLIDAGAEDIRDAEDNIIEVMSKVENLNRVIDYLRSLNITPKESGLIWEAKDKVPVPSNIQGQLENMFSDFEANDDVEDWYTNAE